MSLRISHVSAIFFVGLKDVFFPLKFAKPFWDGNHSIQNVIFPPAFWLWKLKYGTCECFFEIKLYTSVYVSSNISVYVSQT